MKLVANASPWPAGLDVLASRIAHGLISLVFLSCIAVVYLGAWRGRTDTVTLAAIGALCVEGVLVLLSGGNCPLGPLLRKLGDETPFFELFLPPERPSSPYRYLRRSACSALCCSPYARSRRLCAARRALSR